MRLPRLFAIVVNVSMSRSESWAAALKSRSILGSWVVLGSSTSPKRKSAETFSAWASRRRFSVDGIRRPFSKCEIALGRNPVLRARSLWLKPCRRRARVSRWRKIFLVGLEIAMTPSYSIYDESVLLLTADSYQALKVVGAILPHTGCVVKTPPMGMLLTISPAIYGLDHCRGSWRFQCFDSYIQATGKWA